MTEKPRTIKTPRTMSEKEFLVQVAERLTVMVQSLEKVADALEGAYGPPARPDHLKIVAREEK